MGKEKKDLENKKGKRTKKCPNCTPSSSSYHQRYGRCTHRHGYSSIGRRMWWFGVSCHLCGVTGIAALSLATIAFTNYPNRMATHSFNDCVEEVRDSGKSASAAVRYCNGGGTL